MVGERSRQQYRNSQKQQLKCHHQKCYTDDDGCTDEICLEVKKIVLFLRIYACLYCSFIVQFPLALSTSCNTSRFELRLLSEHFRKILVSRHREL